MKTKTMKITGILLTLVLLVTMLGVFAITASAADPTLTTDKYDVTGDGANDSVYEIRTVDDFIWYYTNSTYEKPLNAIMMNDLDLSTHCSETLGSWAAPTAIYLGVFDGNGKTIKNLYINTPDEDNKGLFGQVYFGTIQNLTVTGTVTAKEKAAGFIGYGDVSFYNCVNYVNVTVTERQGAGFLGYQSSNSVIDGCVNYGNITHTGTNTATVAGIVGMYYGKTRNCVNFGTISSANGSVVAGIAGDGYTRDTLVENCVNFGTVSADNGTAIEITYNATEVKNCYYRASAKNNAVYKYATNITVTNVVAVSDEQLADGSLAYTLGEGWGQRIGVDAAPVPGGMKVYYTIDPATLCTADEPTYYYANSENTKRTHDANMPAEDYENGFCPICGAYEPAVDDDGDGYLEIGNVGQLYWFASEVNGGNRAINVELVADITVNSNVLTASGDLNGDPSSFRAWTPVGNSDANAYRGTFQGNGYVISGLYAKEHGVGFFRTISYGGKVYALGVVDSYFENTGYASGAIAGYLAGDSIVIENCFSNATIAGSSYITGGLAGDSNSYATVKNCYYFGKTVGGAFASDAFSWNSKSGNNYYASTTDDGNNYTTAITMEDVTSGKLAYMLGGAYGQNIDNAETVQSYPVISDAKVYYGYTTCDEAQSAPIYTNSSAVSATKPAHYDFVYAASGSEITKHCGECNKLMGTATITAADGKYTGLPVSAVVNGTGDYEGASFVITYTDAEGNSTTTAPTAIGSYTASFKDGGETASVDFTISKGVMSVSVVPTATHEYGDTHVDKAISGKVVISGNEAVEITGTWNWVGDTTTATFISDAEYVDLFEALDAQSVTVTVTQTTPIITVTSPSPSIMPGMSIIFDTEVKNPHTDNPESLPLHYRYVYKIGESGTLQYSSAVKFTIPSDVAIGETIYVYVENYEEDGRYAIGKSNTVKLLVGQVDYTGDIENVQKNLDDAKAELEKAIADGDKELSDEIDALTTALNDAKAALEKADADNKTELVSKIETADTALDAAIKAVQKNLDDAKAELEQAIADLDAAMKQGDADLSTEIASLNTALVNAKAALEKADADNKTELVNKIENADKALDAAIKQVQKNLDDAKAELDTAIKNGDTALDEKITNLNTALDNAITALEATDAANKSELEDKIANAQSTLQAAIDEVASDLAAAEKELADAISKGDAALSNSISSVSASLSAAKSALEKADADNKAALESKIANAEATLDTAIKAVQKNLEDAQAALNKAIADGDTALDGRITDLNTALETAKAALEATDAANKSELEGKITEAQTTLQSAIDKVAKDLADAKTALEKAISDGDSALSDRISALSTALDNAISAYQAADGALKTELVSKIETSDATLDAAIKAVQKNLDDAKAELNKAIVDGDTALDGKITVLNEALATAKAALEAADTANKSELTTKIDEAYASLDAAVKAVQKNLDDLKAALEAKDNELAKADAENKAALEAKDAVLQTFIIIVCVISGVALCGSGAFVVWFFIDRKKRI